MNVIYIKHLSILYSVIIIFCIISLTVAQDHFPEQKSFYEKGLHALEVNKLKEAEGFFKKSINKNADSLSYYELAELYISKNTIHHNSKAHNLLKKALHKYPQNRQLANLKIYLTEKMSTYNAISECRQFLKKDSTHSEMWFSLGKLLEGIFSNYHNSYMDRFSLDSFAQEDFNEAKRCFKKAIQFDSTNVEAYLHLSYLYEYNNLPEKGIPYLENIVKIQPDNKDIHLYLGLLYYKTSRLPDSFRAYKMALSLMEETDELDFTYFSVFKLLGNEYEKKEDQERSEWNYIKTFWHRNDPLYLTDYNERLLEHYTRIAYANLRFGFFDANEKGWQSDRGELMVRYGQPINRTRFNPGAHNRREIWQYPNMSFNFIDGYYTGNFKSTMLPSEFKLLTAEKPQEYIPKFEGPNIKIPFNIVQFKNLESKRNETDLYFTYGLQIVDSLFNKYKTANKHQLGLFLFDRNYKPIYEFRTVVADFDSDQLLSIKDEEEMIINSCFTSVHSDSVVNFALEVIRDFDKGVSANHDSLIIKKFSNDSLCLSDIALCSHIEPATGDDDLLVRNNISLLPNPTNIFSTNSNLYIYYEIYNLNFDTDDLTDFEQTIQLVKKNKEKPVLAGIFNSLKSVFGFKSEEQDISITSQYRTYQRNTPMYLKLDMSNYELGEYLIRIYIKDNISRQQTDEQEMIIYR